MSKNVLSPEIVFFFKRERDNENKKRTNGNLTHLNSRVSDGVLGPLIRKIEYEMVVKGKDLETDVAYELPVATHGHSLATAWVFKIPV